MRNRNFSRLSLLIAAPAVLGLLSVSTAQAAYPFDTMTFDTAASLAGARNYSPPPVGDGFDFGGGNPNSGNSTIGWSNAFDATANGGGSVMMSFPSIADGSGTAQKAGFTLDVAGYPGVTAANLSFDIMLDPNSAQNSNPNDKYGSGAEDASSGYFAIGIRDGSYGFANTGPVYVNGNNAGNGGWNIGDPTYSGTSDKGTWEHISIPLGVGDNIIRGLTFQDYIDNTASGRQVAGDVTFYVDNLKITAVPEPASLAMLALGLPALLVRRRRSVR